MGPKRKRATRQPSTTETAPKGKKGKAANGTSFIAPASPSEEACLAWFKGYADVDDPEMMDITGIETFCNDLGIPVDGHIVLIIAWKIQAAQMGRFLQSEWLTGMLGLKVDSEKKLKALFPSLEAVLHDIENLRTMYKWAFGFARENQERYIGVEMAKGLWKLLLKDTRFNHVESFITFLDEENPVKVVNKDQWEQFFEFSMVVPKNLKKYDESGAWPSLFDQYVEWKSDKLKS